MNKVLKKFQIASAALILCNYASAGTNQSDMTVKVRTAVGKTVPEVTFDRVTGTPATEIVQMLKDLVSACASASKKNGVEFEGDVSLRADWTPMKEFNVIATPITSFKTDEFLRCLSIKAVPK